MAEITINESDRRAMQDAIKHLEKRYDKRIHVVVQTHVVKGQLTFKFVDFTDDLIFQLGVSFQYYHDISLQEKEAEQ